MCGIVALWNKHKSIDPERLLSAVQLLNHRGPDSQNIWLSKNKLCGLGHARLSIIDLVTGTQPLHSRNGKIHAIVNGEFYDFEAIRESLIKKGHVFLTHSDSEILLNLYQEYGFDCLSHLNGEFAFVLYDEEKELLFAARDRFGIKPLFYSFYEGNLYFASEAKSILHLGVPARWDEDAVWLYFYNIPSPTLSCFKGIQAINPGHYLLATKNNASFVEKKYWDIPFPPEQSFETCLSDGEYIEQFQELLTQAIRRRLRADVPIGCYLSGGIDSSAVATITAEHQKVTAFTVAFEEVESLNEFKYANELAKSKGIDLRVLPVTMQDMVNNYAQTLWHTEWPFVDGAPVAKYLLSKFANSLDYRVVLTGEGSDELLAGYPHHWEDFSKFSQDKKTLDLYELYLAVRKRSLDEYKMPAALVSKIVKKIGYVPSIFQVTHFYLSDNYFNTDFQNRHKRQSAELEFLKQIKIPKGIGKANTSLYIQIKSILPSITLNITADRTEMAHSLEGRPPFFDKDLVEFISTLPPHLKSRGIYEKFILKEAMKEKIPDSIYKRIKHPFIAPSIHEHKEKHQNSPFLLYMKEIFNSGLLQQLPFLDHQKIIKQFNKHVKGETTLDLYQLHFILGLCLLSERFEIKE